MKREQLIGFKVNDLEAAAIRRKAKRSGKNLSQYVRTAALNKKIIIIDGLGKWMPELNRIGNNLNQITVILRATGILSSDISQIKIDFGNLVDAVTATLQGSMVDGNYQDCERKVG